MKQLVSSLLALTIAVAPAFAGHGKLVLKQKAPRAIKTKVALGKHNRFLVPPPPPSIPPLFNPPQVLNFQANDVIAFVGDSITAEGTNPGGWCQQVAFWAKNNNPTLNLQFGYFGVAGDTSEKVAARLDTILSVKPTVIIYYTGINDEGFYGVGGLAQFQADLYDLARRAGAAGVRAILFMTPAVRGEKWHGQNPDDGAIDLYAQVMRNFAQASNNPLLDVRELFVTAEYHYNPSNAPAGVLFLDGLHPNAVGQSFLAGAVLKAFGD